MNIEKVVYKNETTQNKNLIKYKNSIPNLMKGISCGGLAVLAVDYFNIVEHWHVPVLLASIIYIGIGYHIENKNKIKKEIKK